jgi:hypothetical protein
MALAGRILMGCLLMWGRYFSELVVSHWSWRRVDSPGHIPLASGSATLYTASGKEGSF